VPPVIAILTDFGLRDYYVAAVKGTILRICAEATLVDVTHDVPPQDVAAGALELTACYRSFPPATIFLAVVDPGVGSSRRAIAAEADGYRFVAPDNGLIAPILDRAGSPVVVELDRSEYAAPSISRTFEGRDRFAPAAAWLAKGVALGSLGHRVEGWTPLELPQPVAGDGAIEGEVVRVDRFGNLVTNIAAASIERLAGGGPVRAAVEGGGWLPLVASYGDVPAGALCALIGSTGHLEISMTQGSAARRLAAGRGARVTAGAGPTVE
jgi:S-adenosylmethionine hydrolase